MPRIEKNVPLKNHTTFKIGGLAKYFTSVKSLEDLKEAINFAKKEKLPLFILGGGSNVLFLDEGYKGLVIKCQMSNVKCQNNEIIAEGGTTLQDIVKLSLKKELTGLEWAVGIPGTLGGAIFGNAGAFGLAIGDFVKNVRVLDKENFQEKNFENKDCKFSYRSSIFKETKKYIILEARLRLKKGEKKEIQKKMKENLSYRQKRHPMDWPSAGCIFKNIPFKKIGKKLYEEIPEILQFKEKGEVPTAFLIDQAGLKGKKIGGAKISERHPGFIINVKNAKAEDVIILISLIKQKIRKKFNILMEEEVSIVSPEG